MENELKNLILYILFFLAGTLIGSFFMYIDLIDGNIKYTKLPPNLFSKGLTDSYCQSRGFDWGRFDTLSCDYTEPIECFDSVKLPRYGDALRTECFTYEDYVLWVLGDED